MAAASTRPHVGLAGCRRILGAREAAEALALQAAAARRCATATTTTTTTATAAAALFLPPGPEPVTSPSGPRLPNRRHLCAPPARLRVRSAWRTRQVRGAAGRARGHEDSGSAKAMSCPRPPGEGQGSFCLLRALMTSATAPQCPSHAFSPVLPLLPLQAPFLARALSLRTAVLNQRPSPGSPGSVLLGWEGNVTLGGEPLDCQIEKFSFL